jgi:hypothetical protein
MTLDDGITTITLPDSLEWIDEYEWSDVKGSATETIGGGLVVEETLVVAGQPITLQSGDKVWVLKSVLDALLALINQVDKTYTLTMPDASTHTVVFDRRSGSPYDAKPVWRKDTHLDESYFTLTLKLIKV